MKNLNQSAFIPPVEHLPIEFTSDAAPSLRPGRACRGPAACGAIRSHAGRRSVAASAVAVTLLGLTAFAVPPPGPVPVAPSPPPMARSAPDAPVVPEEDIMDIRGPIHLPAATPWAAWMAGSLAAVGVGVGAWVLVRRRRRTPPFALALANLEKLRPLMQPESAHAFSLGVSEIVRLFIEECLPVRAAHRTTNEFLHDLIKLPDSVLSEHRGAIEIFLSHCDLAKFARWALTVPDMEAMLDCASAVVVSIGNPTPARMKRAIPNPTPDPAAKRVTAVS